MNISEILRQLELLLNAKAGFEAGILNTEKEINKLIDEPEFKNLIKNHVEKQK